jgi:hypothetical protein
MAKFNPLSLGRFGYDNGFLLENLAEILKEGMKDLLK